MLIYYLFSIESAGEIFYDHLASDKIIDKNIFLKLSH